MANPKTLRKISWVVVTSLVLLIAGNSCSPSPATDAAPAIVITRIVTQDVTQDVTREVTRSVEVTVMVTPGPTSEPTSTLEPTPTATGLPQAVLPQYTDCLYGPATYFSYKTSFPANQQVEMLGRSEDSLWINIEAVGGWNSCWIPITQAQLQNGEVADLPVVEPMLPRIKYEFGSPYTTAKRDGDEVTISWKAIFISADEVRGYFINAYVCQDGKYIHLPVFVSETYESNTGTITVQIRDEAGCTQPSKAHIVSVGRRGFADWEKVFWPPR